MASSDFGGNGSGIENNHAGLARAEEKPGEMTVNLGRFHASGPAKLVTLVAIVRFVLGTLTLMVGAYYARGEAPKLKDALDWVVDVAKGHQDAKPLLTSKPP